MTKGDTMPAYKLTYFNATGLGEPIRYLFHYAGVDFHDDRFERSDWPNLKASMPMEQVPILEFDGQVLYQSKAIGRYLAKEFKLYGKNNVDAAHIDAIVDTIDETFLLTAGPLREENPEFKAKLQATADEKLPEYLKKLEKQAKNRNGHLATSETTWADIYFAGMCEFLSNVTKSDITENYPNLKKIRNTVNGHQNIKKYLSSRPKTFL